MAFRSVVFSIPSRQEDLPQYNVCTYAPSIMKTHGQRNKLSIHHHSSSPPLLSFLGVWWIYYFPFYRRNSSTKNAQLLKTRPLLFFVCVCVCVCVCGQNTITKRKCISFSAGSLTAANRASWDDWLRHRSCFPPSV